nr:oxytocin receptor-like [Penaeus vannamei]
MNTTVDPELQVDPAVSRKMEQLSSHLGYNASMLYNELNSFLQDSYSSGREEFNATTLLDQRNKALAVVEIIVLILILFVAVVGNVFVLIALWRHSLFQQMSRCYLFMLHLSLADLMVALFNILPQLIWEITYRFQGSDLLCRLIKYAQVFVLYVSTYMLVFMAVDRVRAVQGSGRGSLRAARLMIAGAWLVGLVLATPQVLLFAVREIEPGVKDCWVVFELVNERVYVTWFVVSVFLLPLTIIAVSYGYICWAVWHSSGALQPSHSWHYNCCGCVRSRTRRSDVSAAKMKTVRMTLTVVIAFTLCWSPFCIAQLQAVYDRPEDMSTMSSVAVVCMLLGSLNSCTNPWIYLYFSGTLLNQLRVVLGFGPSRSNDNASLGDEDPQEERLNANKRPITHSSVP